MREAPLEFGVAQRPEDARRCLRRACLLDRPLDRVGTARHLFQGFVDLGARRHQARDIIGLLRPRVGRRVILIEQAKGAISASRLTLSGQIAATSAASEPPTELPTRSAPTRCALSMRSRMASTQSRWVSSAVCPRSPPGKPAGTARSPCVSRRGDRETHPSRKAAVAGEKPNARPVALAPDARGKSVDIDGRCFRFAHAASNFASEFRTNPLFGSRCGHERGGRRALARVHWLRPPAILPPGEQRLELRDHLLGEQPRVVLTRSVDRLPNCIMSMSWPTLSVVASSRSCSTISSGEPTMT